MAIDPFDQRDPFEGTTESSSDAFDASSALISADMSTKDIRERFNRLVSHYAQQDFYDIGQCIEKLDSIVSKLKDADIDVSLSRLTYEEKSKLFPDEGQKGKIDAKQTAFMTGLQVSLNIYDQRFLIIPVDDNQFYFMNGIINKDFEKPPKPDPENHKKGSIFDFSDSENIALFFEMVYVTAAHSAASYKVTNEFKSFKKAPTQNDAPIEIAPIEIAKGKTVSPLKPTDLKK